jgi:B12 binding domain.
MLNDPDFETAHAIDVPRVDALARRVLSELKSRPSSELHARLAAFSDALMRDALDPMTDLCGMTVARIRAARVQPADVIDICIPQAARELGDQWIDSGLHFTQVTLATARLQRLIGDLTMVFPDPPALDTGPGILLVVCSAEQHMIGPLVLASQLRRIGCSVGVLVTEDSRMICKKLDRGLFDLILFSCAGTHSLETICSLVQNTRSRARSCPPVVLGGTFPKTRTR